MGQSRRPSAYYIVYECQQPTLVTFFYLSHLLCCLFLWCKIHLMRPRCMEVRAASTFSPSTLAVFVWLLKGSYRHIKNRCEHFIRTRTHTHTHSPTNTHTNVCMHNRNSLFALSRAFSLHNYWHFFLFSSTLLLLLLLILITLIMEHIAIKLYGKTRFLLCFAIRTNHIGNINHFKN